MLSRQMQAIILSRLKTARNQTYIPIEKVREEIEKSLYEQKANSSLYDEWLRDLERTLM